MAHIYLNSEFVKGCWTNLVYPIERVSLLLSKRPQNECSRQKEMVAQHLLWRGWRGMESDLAFGISMENDFFLSSHPYSHSQIAVSHGKFLHQCAQIKVHFLSRSPNLPSFKPNPRSSWHMSRSTMSNSSKQKSSLCPTYVLVVMSLLRFRTDHRLLQQRSSNRWRWGFLYRRCT
jgi:hypothetical protein